MAYIYNENNFDRDGDVWADPTDGGTRSGPITVTQDGSISNPGSTGLELQGGSYSLTVNGTIYGHSTGIFMPGVSTAASKITVGATGSIIGGGQCIYSNHAINIANAGLISADVAEGTSIYIDGEATTFSIVNSGVMEGKVDLRGSANHTVTNSGTIDGAINFLEQSADKLTNSGTITGGIYMGAGNDTFTNTGFAGGDAINSMGTGDDVFKGGKNSEIVRDEEGKDSYGFGDGADYFVATGLNANVGIDKVDGGANAGSVQGDFYSASDCATDIHINLDTKDHHDVYITSQILLKSLATNLEVGIDNIKNFESAEGGVGSDVIFGSAAANTLMGNAGGDALYGLAGKDALYGGSGTDYLTGGAGADKLYGNPDGLGDGETDRFIYTALSDSTLAHAGRDTIYDFEDSSAGNSLDIIDFTGIALAPGLTIIGAGPFTGGLDNSEIRTVQTLTGWTLLLDSNGDKRVDMAIDVVGQVPNIVWDIYDFDF